MTFFRDDGSEDLFCHASQITDGSTFCVDRISFVPSADSLEEGSKVTFDKVFDDRRQKYRAANVRGGVTDDGYTVFIFLDFILFS